MLGLDLTSISRTSWATNLVRIEVFFWVGIVQFITWDQLLFSCEIGDDHKSTSEIIIISNKIHDLLES